MLKLHRLIKIDFEIKAGNFGRAHFPHAIEHELRRIVEFLIWLLVQRAPALLRLPHVRYQFFKLLVAIAHFSFVFLELLAQLIDFLRCALMYQVDSKINLFF